MKSFTPSDDKQLWRVADCIDGQDYSWPVYATYGYDSSFHRCYLVELAIPVETEEQWQFVSTPLNEYAFEQDGARWYIRPEIFEKKLLKCKGVTPSYYLKWNVPTSDANVPTSNVPTPVEEIDEDFVRYCCVMRGEPDMRTARRYYDMFCKFAVRWMLEKHKPVKMGFCTLYALPLRANWCGVLHATWPNILATFRKKKGRRAALEAGGFMESLHNTELVEMQTQETFGWTINAVTEKPFEKAVEKSEAEILASSDASKYVMRYGKLIGGTLNAQILEVFQAWLEKAARPFAHVDTTVARRDLRLVPRTGRGRIRPAATPPPVTMQTTECHQPHEPVSPNVATEIPNEDLPPVPDVQS